MFDSRYPWVAALFFFFAAHTAAAADRIYEIGMAVDPNGLERTFSGWYDRGGDRANDPLDDAELASLAKLYAEKLTGPDEIRQKFRGVFAARMPQDVGGAGTYQTLSTPLGSAHWYSERFGTAGDADGQVIDRREAVDLIVDITAGWFEKEMKDSPHLPAVRRFVNQDLREDLRKLAVTLWLAQASDNAADNSNDDDSGNERRELELANRLLHYCQEHGYFAAEELPRVRFVFSGNSDDENDAFRMIRGIVARKCGIDAAKADEVFAFFGDQATLMTSWQEYLQTAPKFAPVLKKWREANGHVDQDGEDVFQAFGSLIEDNFDLGFSFGSSGESEVRIALQAAVEPFETNGVYDEVEGIVSWRRVVKEHRIGLPPYCYAHWCVPDVKFQQAHFGETLLDGEELSHFAALYATITPAQRAELAAFWAVQTPGEKLQDKLGEFKFKGPADAAAEAAAGKLNEMLMHEL